jgi:two-component system, response regulator
MNANRHFLLVEDDQGTVEMVRYALGDGDSSIEMVHLQDGAEALDYLHGRNKFHGREHGSPAVMLLDLKMPRIDGLEVLRRVKNDAHLKILPIVMLTSSKNPGDIRKCYESGANAYVVKPVDFQRFIVVIKQLVAFWMTINQPPLPVRPESASRSLSATKG